MEFAFMLITAGLSAVMAGLVTYKVNELKEAKSFRGRKAEELYCAVEALDRELSRFFDGRCTIADSSRRAGGSSDDALQIAGARLVDAKMLVGFYFPVLSSALARCIAAVATAHASLRLWENAGRRQSRRSPRRSRSRRRRREGLAGELQGGDHRKRSRRQSADPPDCIAASGRGRRAEPGAAGRRLNVRNRRRRAARRAGRRPRPAPRRRRRRLPSNSRRCREPRAAGSGRSPRRD